MIHIKQRPLRSFKQHRLPFVDVPVQEFRDIGEVDRQLCAECVSALEKPIRVYGNANLFNVYVLPQVAPQLVRIREIADTKAAPAHLVFVSRAYASTGRADPGLAPPLLIAFLNKPVVFKDKMRAIADKQPPLAGDPCRRQTVYLLFERNRVDHDPVTYGTLFLRMQDPGRNEMKNIFAAVNDYSMTGVVTALIAGYYVEMSSKQVDDLPLTLITPLGTNDY